VHLSFHVATAAESPSVSRHHFFETRHKSASTHKKESMSNRRVLLFTAKRSSYIQQQPTTTATAMTTTVTTTTTTMPTQHNKRQRCAGTAGTAGDIQTVLIVLIAESHYYCILGNCLIVRTGVVLNLELMNVCGCDWFVVRGFRGAVLSLLWTLAKDTRTYTP